FSADQMALHGKRVAAAHVLGDASLPEHLLDRLASNERVPVARTLWRVLLSRRRLLEWPSADVSADCEPGTLQDLVHAIRTMAFGPMLAIGCAAAFALLRPAALVAAAPLLALWILSPGLEATGDSDVLDRSVPFLEGRAVNAQD